MIRDFEEITQPLNKEELRIANHLFYIFKSNRKFRTNKFIRSDLFRVFGIKINPPRIRSIIHYMRCELCNGGYVIATSKGYKFVDTLQEKEDYLLSMDQRINSQLEIYNSLVDNVRRQKTKERSLK